MPKQAQYDVMEILEYSVEIFSEGGYSSTSIEEIMGQTGFNRRGFYIEFKSKKGFLHNVLEHYIKTRLMPCQYELIHKKAKGTQAIESYFHEYRKLVAKNGCLLVSCINELGKKDKVIQSIARHYYDSLQLGFISCLETAQRYGQVRQSINIEAIALQLSCFSQGFAISSILSEGEFDVIIAMKDLLTSIRS